MIENVYWSSRKITVFLSDFIDINFLNRFSRNTHISSSTKIHPMGAELCHSNRRVEEQTDRQTDRHGEGDSLFRNFANAPQKNGTNIICSFNESIFDNAVY